MEQNGSGPAGPKLTLEYLANIRRENELETANAKREGRTPVLVKPSVGTRRPDVVVVRPEAASTVSVRQRSIEPCDQAADWELMTSAEAAKFLGLSTKGLRNLASAGKVPHYKLFGQNRFRKSELLSLLTKVETRD